MKILRSIVLIFAFVVFGTGSLFFNFIIFPLNKLKLDEKDYINYSSKTIRALWTWFLKFMEAVKLIKIKVKNPEALKNIENKVIVSTHPSFIDIIILITLIPKSTCFVKNSLTKNFILKNIVNSIFIPNDISIEELKSETKRYLDNGFNIIVFPMGIRHRKNEFPKIKKGASLIALNAKKDITPIKLYSDEDFLFIKQPFWSAGSKIVEFEIEICSNIEIEKFSDCSDIIAKRHITDEIKNSLYNN